MPAENKVEKTPEELFAESFAAEVAPDSGAENAAAEALAADDAAAAADVDAAAAEAKAADDAAAAEAKGDEEPPAEETPAEQAPAVEAPAEQAPAVEAPKVDFEAEAKRLATELAALKAAQAPEAKKEEPAPVVDTTPEPPTEKTVLTDEELGIVATYDEEWPDVAKAEALKRKVDLAVMEDKIYREVAVALKGILGTVNPIVQSAQQTAEEKHYAAIEAAHPDYLEVVKDIDSWIEKQPKYLQTAMNAVLDSGSAVEVNDLFARFKQETGRVAPQVKPDQSLLQSKPAVDETVDETVVQAMAPVIGGRKAAVSSAVDPNDFSGAWKEAAAK